jgi:hypothetical protein
MVKLESKHQASNCQFGVHCYPFVTIYLLLSHETYFILNLIEVRTGIIPNSNEQCVLEVLLIKKSPSFKKRLRNTPHCLLS